MRIKSELAMLDYGKQLSAKLKPGMVVFLEGDLGAGKTTLVRGVLRGLGHEGSVKSPTYNIVEEYRLAGLHCYHFDLYRLNDPEELEYMGIRDYLSASSISFIEWADKGESILPKADLIVRIDIIGEEREVSNAPVDF